MPTYIFQHPVTNETREVTQRMTEEHVFVDDKGVKWNRIFAIPQASMDTMFDPHSSYDFKKKTRDKNYTVGQMWDMSAELSQKRGGATGKDEVRQKAEDSYTKKTGKPHPHAPKSDTAFI